MLSYIASVDSELRIFKGVSHWTVTVGSTIIEKLQETKGTTYCPMTLEMNTSSVSTQKVKGR